MLTFSCAGCGATLSSDEPAGRPFACPAARPGDGIDHVLARSGASACPLPDDGEANPFVRYRHQLAAYALSDAVGLGDDAFVDLVKELDDAIGRVDGRGFRETPFKPATAVGARLGFTTGEVWVKDETRNVSGSHKARHLMGIMLYLLVGARRLDPDATLSGAGEAHTGAGAEGRTRVGVRGPAGQPPLAIASCGNAALAAAVVSRAAGWALEVFVPPSASPAVLQRLEQLSAGVHVCERDPAVPGDPCYHAFRAAVSRGAIPFCCQGPDNGLTLDGGKTIAWEMVGAFRRSGTRQWAGGRLDAVFVQVGGGALAASVVEGFQDALRLRSVDRLPRFYTVQTTGAYPLKRAYDEVAERVLARVPLVIDQGFSPASDRERAELMMRHPEIVEEQMRLARRHRGQFMHPWEKTPRSIAHGILDDETYDWAVVVEGMLRTGGWPLVVSEDRLVEANTLGREATGIDVDHTGSAGLAGLLKAIAIDARLVNERVAVIFSGVTRS
jgi:threonine synthase